VKPSSCPLTRKPRCRDSVPTKRARRAPTSLAMRTPGRTDFRSRSHAAATFSAAVICIGTGSFLAPIRTVLRGKGPVIRTDGLFVRDYFYIEDAAAAYLLLAEALTARPELRGQTFNFSNEERTTVLDIVSRIVRPMGSDLEPDVRGEPSTEIRE